MFFPIYCKFNSWGAKIRLMKRQKDILYIPEQKSGRFQMRAIHVTFKRDTQKLKQKLKKEDFDLFLKLYEETQSCPKNTIVPLEEMLGKYSDVAELYNLLSYAYICRRRIKKAENITQRAYEIIPDDLFVKINYADQCLRKSKTELVPKIFDYKEDLKLLYPERRAFHISEFRGFMNVMGFYYLSLGDREKAECFYYLSYKTDPNHPSTRLLGKRLYQIPFLKKIATKFHLKRKNTNKII